MNQPPHVPTAYPEVNQVLYDLLGNVQRILQERFVGLYLFGSLATGEWQQGRSDIDFTVLTDEDRRRSGSESAEYLRQLP